jgi:hypothetical protein
MNQKGYVNIILIVLVAILAGVVGYLTLIKKPTSPAITDQIPPTNTPTQQTLPITSPKSTPKPVNWEILIPAIRTVIGSTSLGVYVEESRPLSIFQKNDITGDGIPEALVDLGSGGAYTSYLTLMRIENNKPVIAQFKQKDGKISPLMFLVGASVMNGETVVMLPDKNAIYAGHWSRAVSGTPFGGLTDCSVEAYQWNLQTKTFDYSISISNEVRPGFCQKADQY